MDWKNHYNKQTLTLTIPHTFNSKITNLPVEVEKIIFSGEHGHKRSMFNKSVDNLHEGITEITFGYYFDQQINNLPNSLKKLSFGWMFNKPVDCLPNKITDIIFGYVFNQSVDNLPNSLMNITFGNNFNQLVDNLPISITSIKFGYNFDKKINFRKLVNLTHLDLGIMFNRKLDYFENDLHNSKIKKLLPKSLQYLKLSRDLNIVKLPKLPKKLKEIHFGEKFNNSINKLPDSIETIYFFDISIFNCEISKYPINLKKLVFGKSFNKPLNNLLNGLEYLEIGYKFTHDLHFIPKSVRELCILPTNPAIDNIPEHIETLIIKFCIYDSCYGITYNKFISNIPPTVKKIKINYKHKISFITKIPFGCIITDLNDNSII